jgi:hypothetical protein
MKILPILIASLLFSAFANAECVTVDSGPPKPSFRNVRIVASVEGKPVRDASVEVLLEGKDLFSLRTDQHGIAALPPLHPGYYWVTATSDNRWQAGTYLYIVDDSSKKTTTLRLGLQPPTSAAQQELNAAAREVLVTEHLQFFKGTVQEPSGGRVPGAVIQLFPKDFQVKPTPIRLTANENGNFSAPLADGAYVVVIGLPGFKSFIAGLQIARSGEAQELQVSLKIASGCQARGF